MENRINYIGNFYKNKPDVKSFFKGKADTAALEECKKKIRAAQEIIEENEKKISSLNAAAYQSNFEPRSKEIVIEYTNNRTGEVTYFSLAGVVTEHNEDDHIIEISKKVGTFKYIVGYAFEMGGIIERTYKYTINTNCTKINLTHIYDDIRCWFTGEVYRYDCLASMVDNGSLPRFVAGNWPDEYDPYFLCKLYGIDRNLPGNLGKLDYMHRRKTNNASFEIILKTAPDDLLQVLIEKNSAVALPIHEQLGIGKKFYERLYEKGIIKDYLELSDIIFKFKENLGYTEDYWIDFIEKCKGYEEDMEFYRISVRRSYAFSSKGLAKEILWEYCNSQLWDTYSLGKYLTYMVESCVNQGFSSIYDCYTELRDYRSMCHDIKIKPLSYSSNLKMLHDLTSRNYKINLSAIQEEDFKKICESSETEEIKVEKNEDHGEFVYYMVPPKTTSDLKAEGSNLGHCVYSYLKKILDGRCKILFLRSNPEESQITIEINDNKIVQVRGASNRDPNKEEIAALETYAASHGLELVYRANW